MSLHWFPGHMHKAKQELEKVLPKIDVVIEVLDARAPYSSQNPLLDTLLGSKPKVVILNKADAADPNLTAQWVDYFRAKNVRALPFNAMTGQGHHAIVQACQKVVEESSSNKKRYSINVIIVGIPNVGKSMIINKLKGRKVAKAENKPGVTRTQQWVEVSPQFFLLDTPGILWPKFEVPHIGLTLASIGTLKDTIAEPEEVAQFICKILVKKYLQLLKNRYKLDTVPEPPFEIVELIGKKRGLLGTGGVVNVERTAILIIQELRTGKIGRVTFENP